MLLYLDQTSAGVVAGVFSALLIAISVQRRTYAPKGAPKWQRKANQALEVLRLITAVLTASSIVICLLVVAGGSVGPVINWYVSVTMWFLLAATSAWFTNNFVGKQEPQ